MKMDRRAMKHRADDRAAGWARTLLSGWALAVLLVGCLGGDRTGGAGGGGGSGTPADPCEGQSCGGHGDCKVREDGSARCECDPGYEPAEGTCRATAGPCASVTCSGHGVCNVQGDAVVCVCDPGYRAAGTRCLPEPLPDPCDGVACSGHGVCIDQDGQATCHCSAGYRAEQLECVKLAEDPCQGIDCGDHGRCEVDGGLPICRCEAGHHVEGLSCVEDDPCTGITCSGHGSCRVREGIAVCDCAEGYQARGTACIREDDPCDGQDCSGHGSCRVWDGTPICVCDRGHTPSSAAGMDCVPTSQVCAGGPIDHDVDGDGVNEDWFEPTADECEMYELLNRIRASHDPEGSPECHQPLLYSVEWSAHGRNHSKQMAEQGQLFHADYRGGQNCAMGCGPECELDMYMNGPGEGHCPPLSHHCNIMRCGFSHVGIGYWGGTWNTQNFF